MLQFSVIIPVYNRPDEVKELLESLSKQSLINFEVIVIEDGSTLSCKEVVNQFHNQLNLHYFYKVNEGRSIARNYGIKKANTNYYIIFDSDCIVPENYFAIVTQFLQTKPLDCFGGPDRAQDTFTPTQKAISYAMTSFLTTGGMRGSNQSVTKFYPRSFNMGFSKQVFKVTQGFPNIPLAEDIDLSMKIIESGFSTGLIADAFVYHKRRTSLKQFYRQVNRFGIGRIDIAKRHLGSLKIIHFFPLGFVFFTIFSIVLALFIDTLFLLPLLFYALAVLIDSFRSYQSLQIAFLSLAAVFIQMFAYGLGFGKAFVKRILLKQGEFGRY
jgi:glycosyltransferase involved in cell wall biosynthesis